MALVSCLLAGGEASYVKSRRISSRQSLSFLWVSCGGIIGAHCKGGFDMGGSASQEQSGDYDSLYQSYIALHKDVDHLSTVREIGLAIKSSIELSEVLPIIANVVQGALDVSKLTIYELRERNTTAVPVVAKYGRDLITRDRLEEESVYVEGSPIKEAITDRVPVIVNTEYQSSAFVPLIAKGVPLGVMRLDDRKDGTKFAQDDAQLLQAIGSMIAIAINHAELYAMAVTDGLTKLYVRRYFDLRMEEELEQARRYGRNFSLLLLDIDHFKKFNDTHGHQTGDAVLRQFAVILQDNTRKSDVACRYGGEEMAIILPETALEEASLLANKLCQLIREYGFQGTGPETLSVTASIGVTQYHEDFTSPNEMVEVADQALYTAKDLGRNRVELARL